MEETVSDLVASLWRDCSSFWSRFVTGMEVSIEFVSMVESVPVSRNSSLFRRHSSRTRVCSVMSPILDPSILGGGVVQVMLVRH